MMETECGGIPSGLYVQNSHGRLDDDDCAVLDAFILGLTEAEAQGGGEDRGKITSLS